MSAIKKAFPVWANVCLLDILRHKVLAGNDFKK